MSDEEETEILSAHSDDSLELTEPPPDVVALAARTPADGETQVYRADTNAWEAIEQLMVDGGKISFVWISTGAAATPLEVRANTVFRSCPTPLSIASVACQPVGVYTDDNHGMVYNVVTEYEHCNAALAADRVARVEWSEPDIFNLDDNAKRCTYMLLVHKFWDAFSFSEGWRHRIGLKEAQRSQDACERALKRLTYRTHYDSKPVRDQAKVHWKTAKHTLCRTRFLAQNRACNRCGQVAEQILAAYPERLKQFTGLIDKGGWPGGQVCYEVDHVVPTMWGGSSDKTNLQILCRRCHHAKTAIEAMFNKPLAAQLRWEFAQAEDGYKKQKTAKGTDAHRYIQLASRPAIYNALWDLHKLLWHRLCPVSRNPERFIGVRTRDARIEVNIVWNDPRITVRGGAFRWPDTWEDFKDVINNVFARAMLRGDAPTRALLGKGEQVVAINKILHAWSIPALRMLATDHGRPDNPDGASQAGGVDEPVLDHGGPDNPDGASQARGADEPAVDHGRPDNPDDASQARGADEPAVDHGRPDNPDDASQAGGVDEPVLDHGGPDNPDGASQARGADEPAVDPESDDSYDASQARGADEPALDPESDDSYDASQARGAEGDDFFLE